MFSNDNTGFMTGIAIGLGRRMRNIEASHAENIDRYRDQIDRLVEQRDRHATRLIARERQISAITEILEAALNALPETHPMNLPTDALDISGNPMTRAQVAIGIATLEKTLQDNAAYHDTLRQISLLIGLSPSQKRAWYLRNSLSSTGLIDTAFDLLKEIQGNSNRYSDTP